MIVKDIFKIGNKGLFVYLFIYKDIFPFRLVFTTINDVHIKSSVSLL